MAFYHDSPMFFKAALMYDQRMIDFAKGERPALVF
jgi:hypothetical protein